jgi:hypothetical protein
MEEHYRKEKEKMENELKDNQNKVAVLESKLKKADQLIRTYK